MPLRTSRRAAFTYGSSSGFPSIETTPFRSVTVSSGRPITRATEYLPRTSQPGETRPERTTTSFRVGGVTESEKRKTATSSPFFTFGSIALDSTVNRRVSPKNAPATMPAATTANTSSPKRTAGRYRVTLRAVPEAIDRERVQELARGGAQLVEVLPAEEYEDEHLPGAVNIPLKELDAESVAQLDRARPVIVYCYDYQ